MNKNICVIGGCQGAGATFLSTTLAFIMAEKIDGITFVESPSKSGSAKNPSLINQLSMEKVFRNNSLKLFENVNWILSWEEKSLASLEKINGSYKIWDSPNSYRNCDLIICVIDALPSKVMASTARVGHLKAYFSNRIVWVLNRDFNGDRKSIETYLGIKFDFEIPVVEQEIFYRAEKYGRPLAKSKFLDDEIKKRIGIIGDYIISLY